MPERTRKRNVVIVGAAGRDFHNFNVVYRDDPSVRVVAFTATQIPGIERRRYPAALAGAAYPDGISIVEESQLETLCRRHEVDEVVFAYSDVTHETVMHLASRAMACGADFTLLGPSRTMLRSARPVIAVSAVRTGCGKSQTARYLSRRLRNTCGLRVAVLRHPMPYGDLEAERVQRFATLADLDVARCTAEEREEYEPHIEAGNLVFAGVDYAAILAAAEREADVVVWDGGNNDFPFLQPDLHIAVVDALRPAHVASHHPGETVARMADVVIVNKVDAASSDAVEQVIGGVRAVNPKALLVRAASPVVLADIERVRGKRVIVVEDGPTITHGGMHYGAGFAAAVNAQAIILDPRASAPKVILDVYARYPHIGRVLPAVGYGDEQIDALRETIRRSECEVVVSASPIDLAALLRLDKPVVRANYDYADAGEPTLAEVIDDFVARKVGDKRRPA